MTRKSNIQFDLDKALEDLKAGKPMSGKDGFLTPLIKQLTKAALQAEQEAHLEQDASSNRKNGHTSKTVKSSAGSFELNTPRDRDAPSSHSWSRSTRHNSRTTWSVKFWLSTLMATVTKASAST